MRTLIAQGLEACLYMGKMDAMRDWGHVKDYVRFQGQGVDEQAVVSPSPATTPPP